METGQILLNHFNESLRLSRVPLYQNQENILLISEEGGQFKVAKFTFNFLSCFSSVDTDIIFAPISTESLSLICQALCFKKVDKISTEDLELLGIYSNYFLTVSESSDKRTEDVKTTSLVKTLGEHRGAEEFNEKDEVLTDKKALKKDELEHKALKSVCETEFFEDPESKPVTLTESKKLKEDVTKIFKYLHTMKTKNWKRYSGEPFSDWKVSGTQVVCTQEKCNKVFSDVGTLRRHHRETHIRVQCPECLKMFSMQFINNHILLCQKRQKKFVCDMCGNGFNQKYKFEKHKKMHEGQRFRCRYPDCKSNQEYKDSSNRIAHERKKHGASYTKFMAEN